jgi:hypothetical protein
MRRFGADGRAERYGYDLELLIGWLEALQQDEENTMTSFKGPKARRMEKFETALELLNDINGTPG